MKKHPSRDQLTRSLDRRIKHLMIRVLEKFEDRFPDVDNSRDGQVFKSDLRNAFNDVIRAQRDELRDYDIEYRPLQMNDDNTLAITQTFMQTVQNITFDAKPSIRFCTGLDHQRVLEALRSELGAGVIYSFKDESQEPLVPDVQEGLILEIVGAESCVNCVLPIMDRYRLHGSVAPGYDEWRDAVVKIYRS